LIILDENIPDSERALLRDWRIRVHQVGHEIGRKGMKDEEIVPFLHRRRSAVFFTRDLGFYLRTLCHPRYCLVCLAVSQYEVASFVRRLLRHRSFNTRAKRMGSVLLVSHTGIRRLRPRVRGEEEVGWSL
jgi:hypothetical protein